MEVYIRSTESIDKVAEIIRRCLNVADNNVTLYQREQKRKSANYGGTYFLFEVFGLTLALLHNSGDVAIPERSNFEYYVVVSGQYETEYNVLRTMCDHLSYLAKKAGLDTAVEDLS